MLYLVILQRSLFITLSSVGLRILIDSKYLAHTLLVRSRGAGGGGSSSPSPPSGLPLEEVSRSLLLDELKCKSSLEESDFWSTCSRARGALTGCSGLVLPLEVVVVGGEGEEESNIKAGASPPPSTGEDGESGEETEPNDSLLSCLLYNLPPPGNLGSGRLPRLPAP